MATKHQSQGGLSKDFQDYLFSRGLEVVDEQKKDQKKKVITYGKRRNALTVSSDIRRIASANVVKQGVLKYYSKGMAVLGFKLPIGASWREVFLVVTKDGRLRCADEQSGITSTFDLMDCRILSAEEETSRPFSFCVVDFASNMQMFFQAADYDEYADWLNKLTWLDSEDEEEEESPRKANPNDQLQAIKTKPDMQKKPSSSKLFSFHIPSPSTPVPSSPGLARRFQSQGSIKLEPVKASYTDQRDANRRKAAVIKIQSRFRGYRVRKELKRMKKATLKIQSIFRMYLTRKRHPEVRIRIGQLRLFFKRRARYVITIQRWFRANRRVDERQVESSMTSIMKDHEYRTSVVKEILATEESYVRDLDTVVQVYLHPMRALFIEPVFTKRDASAEVNVEERSKILADPKGGKEPADNSQKAVEKKFVVTQAHLERLFSNIEQIIEKHWALLASLRKAVEDWSPTQTIGNIFIELGDSVLIEHYVTYCNNFDHAMNVLEECKEKNLIFKTFLENTLSVKRVKKYQLAAFLTLPVQRLPRYILLLKDLVKHTHPGHPDFVPLRAGLEKMQRAVAVVDKAKTKNETRKQRGRLQQKFLQPTTVSNIFSSDSAFCLLEGPVLVASSKTPNAPKSKSYILLFTDQLVMVRRVTDRSLEISSLKRKGGKKELYHKTYRFSDAFPIPMDSITSTAEPLPESQGFAFEFESTKGFFRMFVKNADDRKNWVREINKAKKAFDLRNQ